MRRRLSSHTPAITRSSTGTSTPISSAPQPSSSPARLLPDEDAAEFDGARPIANSCGTILLFFLVNIEIADFYSTGPVLTFNFLSSSLAQDLTYTIGWAVFAVAMLIAGLLLHSRATRIAAIILLLVTVLKCFLHDLARLGGLYRVGSLLGLTISLLLVGVLLQKFVIRKAAAGGIRGFLAARWWAP